MAAAVSISRALDANSADQLALLKRLSSSKQAMEAPIGPVNTRDEDLLYRASDLGVLGAEMSIIGLGVDATSTTTPQGPQERTDVSATAQIAAAHTGARIVRAPRGSALPYHFELRQQWEGVVTRVAQDEFTVVLRDLTPAKASDLEAVLPLEEVSDEDLPLLTEGAVLYWTIGYEHTLTGQRKRVSIIRLRRLPAWSRKDIGRVKERAAELKKLFGG